MREFSGIAALMLSIRARLESGRKKARKDLGFIDACRINVLVRLFRANSNKRFVSGHDFSRAVQAANDEGFSPMSLTLQGGEGEEGLQRGEKGRNLEELG